MNSKLLLPMCLVIGVALTVLSVLSADDDGLDAGKVRQVRQKALRGEKLTPEEQAYYELAKAARKKGELPAKKKTSPAPATVVESGKASIGIVPLCDLTADQKYKGQDGGLYGGGKNDPPVEHWKAALSMAAKIQPLDSEGKPSANGKIVLLTHGMSNTTNESQQFIQVANSDPHKNPAVIIVDGAQGGVDARQWVTGKATRNGSKPWDRLTQRITMAGATPQQVQVVWVKHALSRVGQYGEFPKHAQQLQEDLSKIVRMLKERFPNLQLAYISSRSYAGYATTELNPEPFAYESAFAVRGLIQDQVKGNVSLSYSTGRAPLLMWGPYLWADGEKGRKADGLMYRRSDYRDDGTHPSDTGRQKVAEQLLTFFSSNPTAKNWFLVPTKN